LSAGIDLALHVVSRYYGHEAANSTAYDMEYLSAAWTDPRSNHKYAKPPAVAAGEALCPVCWMNVDPKISSSSLFKGKRYYFCVPGEKQRFEAAPERFLEA
jgi:YHS domain-containing protein